MPSVLIDIAATGWPLAAFGIGTYLVSLVPDSRFDRAYQAWVARARLEQYAGTTPSKRRHRSVAKAIARNERKRVKRNRRINARRF